MFLQVCVCPRGGGCLPQCMLGCHTPPGPGRPPWDQADPPPDQADPPGTRQTPPRTRQTPPDQADTPQDQADTPPGPGRHPPGPGRHPPSPREADSSIRSTSGRYASYWNAFLFLCEFPNGRKFNACQLIVCGKLKFR